MFVNSTLPPVSSATSCGIEDAYSNSGSTPIPFSLAISKGLSKGNCGILEENKNVS